MGWKARLPRSSHSVSMVTAAEWGPKSQLPTWSLTSPWGEVPFSECGRLGSPLASAGEGGQWGCRLPVAGLEQVVSTSRLLTRCWGSDPPGTHGWEKAQGTHCWVVPQDLSLPSSLHLPSRVFLFTCSIHRFWLHLAEETGKSISIPSYQKSL